MALNLALWKNMLKRRLYESCMEIKKPVLISAATLAKQGFSNGREPHV